MPVRSPSRHRQRSFRFVVWPLLAAFAPLLLGIPFVFWQADQTLSRQTRDSVDSALTQANQILTHAQGASNSVRDWVGHDCEDAVFSLRQQSMAAPFVRSLNLARKGEIYCTSLLGAGQQAEEAQAYAQGRLRLMAGNRVTPDRAVLILRTPTANGSVLAGIDGQYFIDALQLAGQHMPLTLQVGDFELSADGTTSRRETLAENAAALHASTAYPFRIFALPPENSRWLFIQAHFAPVLGLLLLFCAAAGGGVLWLTLHRNSPVRDLERGLQANEFIAHYQLILDGDSGHWAGMEVLMRWQHPRVGLIPPDQFIPLAESSGVIVAMTQRLMRDVRNALAAQVDALPHEFRISFNLSSAHCRDRHLLEDCRDFLSAFSPGRIDLVLELTERELFQASAHTDRLFGELRDMGVHVALDDFGTGHASLAYLRHFRVDYLKIDRSFVAMSGRDVLTQHLLDNMLDLARRLNLGIVAEGIETREQEQYLRQRGVRYLQGYLYARPAPLEDVMARLKIPAQQDPH